MRRRLVEADLLDDLADDHLEHRRADEVHLPAGRSREAANHRRRPRILLPRKMDAPELVELPALPADVRDAKLDLRPQLLGHADLIAEGGLWSSVNGSGTHAGPAFQRASDPDAPLVDLDPFLTSRRVQLVTLAARHAAGFAAIYNYI